MSTNIPPKNPAFVSRKAELNYQLTCLDGKVRNDQLGILHIHYHDKRKAEEWYDSILMGLKPEERDVNEAVKVLDELYGTIVNY